MTLPAEAVVPLLQHADLPRDDAGLANILEARGIRALAGSDPAGVDDALRGLRNVDRLVQAGVHPGKELLCKEVSIHLGILHEATDPSRVKDAKTAIAKALEDRDAWWLRSLGLRAVGQESAARTVVKTMRSFDDFLMADSGALAAVVELAKQRCEAAADQRMTIWQVVAAFDEDLAAADEEGGFGFDEAPTDHPETAVYRSFPKGPVVLVSNDGALSSAALEAYLDGHLDPPARQQVERRVGESPAEQRRLEAHREAFAAREIARRVGPTATSPQNNVEWEGKVPLLQYQKHARVAATTEVPQVLQRSVNAFSSDMSFALEPGMDEHRDTFVTLRAWLNGRGSTCNLEVWVQREPAAAHELHAVYSLRSDDNGRINRRLPLLPAPVESIKFRLVRG